MTDKMCSGCQKAKPLSEFWPQRRRRRVGEGFYGDGLQARCKACQVTERRSAKQAMDPELRKKQQRESRRRWAEANPRRHKSARLKRLFGIDVETYDAMRAAQLYRCAIDGRSEATAGRELAVDHCHQGEGVRGLLCADCNQSLGKLGDDLYGVLRAVAYLARFELGDVGVDGWMPHVERMLREIVAEDARDRAVAA